MFISLVDSRVITYTRGHMTKTRLVSLVFCLICWLVPIYVWFSFDFAGFTIDRDWSRDLKEISNIHQGSLVWLGPWLDPGLHASSSYYYFFYPSLWLASGSPMGMIYFNLVLFALALGLLTYFAYQRFGISAGLISLAVGLTPMMLESTIHPGNGYTYLALVMIGLGWWLFRSGRIVSTAHLGLASSFHPGAVILLPVLSYRLKSLLKKPFQLALNVFILFLPWLPLIGFEILTSGFVTRQFLAQPSSGSITFSPGLNSLSSLAHVLGLRWQWLVLAMGITSLILWRSSQSRYRSKLVWIWLYALGLVLVLSLFAGVLQRYMYGLAFVIQLVILVVWASKPWSRLILAGYVCLLLVQVHGFQPRYMRDSLHTIERVSANTKILDDILYDYAEKKLAFLTIMEGDTFEPQADDYRAYLRFLGHNVVDVTQSDEAEYLFIVLEDGDFDWREWSTWETEQFGEKELVEVLPLSQDSLIIYRSIQE